MQTPSRRLAERGDPVHRRLSTVIVAAAVTLTVGSLPASTVAASTAPARATAAAPGAPGAESFYDLARKDCVGTARNSTSKIWWTIANGVLSDVYEPTVDTTNVKTMQYIVTNGRSWTDLQERDMTYTVSSDPTGMSCTVTTSSIRHRYQLITTYIADPGREAVVLHTAYHGPAGLTLYVRLEPLVGGNGGGGFVNGGADSADVDTTTGSPVPVAYDTNTATQAVNRNYGAPTYEALRQQGGFPEASVGYAGTVSDGLSMLDTSHTLTDYQTAPGGHAALTSRVALDGNGEVTMALGFGRTREHALRAARLSVAAPFSDTMAAYLNDWLVYDAALRKPPTFLAGDLRVEYYKSVNVVKASEDKTFPGAIAAGLASPWGQSVSAGQTPQGLPSYFGSYREVFARDLYEAFTGLLVAGDRSTAQAAARFLLERQQQADGSMPRNSLLNGLPAPDTGGVQLDETSYPIIMAWQSGLASDSNLYLQHIQPAANFLVAHGPSAGVERWEEQGGYSPSTIAAEIAGLTAASATAKLHGDAVHARVYQATADDFARNIKGWTVTTTGGPQGNATYFLRLSKTGDPNAAISYNLGNGGPTVDQRSIIDGGFQELVRLGILPATDQTVAASVKVVDSVIRRRTPSGPGYYRYGASSTQSDDGYGDCYQPSGSNCSVIGAPWPPTGVGTGHLWPVLSGERAEYDLSAGNIREAGTLLRSMNSMTAGVGLMPEQTWEYPALAASPYGSDPATASIGFRPGRPAGSASPLTWAQAQFARLVLNLGAGRPLERPDVVADRYLPGRPAPLPVTITSPTNGQNVTGTTVAVTGTTAPHVTVSVEADNALSPLGGATASTTSDGSGNFNATVAIRFGTTTLTVAATYGASTGYAQVTVNSTALPGETVLNLADPTGDDNGPGNYAYPTSPDFKPGAFDITSMRINKTADTVYVQVGVRDLESTFGASMGAQLIDLYVHDPAATSTSTAAAYPTRNYTIAPASAWSERIEVQGFAPAVWVDATGATPGIAEQVVTVSPDTTGTVTVVVPRAAFGNPTSQWSFALTLTGQDGFNGDQARGFTPTPGSFTFGVCATVNTDPHCTVDPNTVPKVIDTVPPDGVMQSVELDYTLGPVVLQGVAVP
jgi:glucoamylase